MRKKIFRSILALLMMQMFCTSAGWAGPSPAVPKKGFWATCLGHKNILESVQKMDEAIALAKEGGYSLLLVQVYRGDQAWFDSSIADETPFLQIRSKIKADPLKVLIEHAHKQGIEVHAWINTLTLSRNRHAKILSRFGYEILTKDQHGRLPVRQEPGDPLEAYYDKENQLFLEPGDPRVRRHVVDIVKEIASRYPTLDGIHFDYVRYPAAPPFIPGSRFNAFGLSYGYGEQNVLRFKQATKTDPFYLKGTTEESLRWDAWRRDQITGLLSEASLEARKANRRLKISCAVIPAFERGYASASQDWPRWVEENIVDFVVVMDYSLDSRLAALAAKSAIGLAGDSSKVYIGLGAYLMQKNPKALERQVDSISSLKPAGIIFFDYDTLLNNPSLKAASDSN